MSADAARISACATIFMCSAVLAHGQLTMQEQRGRQIYERGRGLLASLGAGEASIPGTVLPCVNCHGHDGRGKAEGGIVPSDITWDALTKPYGVRHPPYTERLLKRAVTMGIDSAGNLLNAAMPRFQLSNDDMSDLTAYVKRLGQSVDPGLTATSIRWGVILPAVDRSRRIVRETLTRYVEEVNGAGGVYGRRIELRFTEFAGAKELHEFIEREQIFAFTGSFLTTEIGEVLRETVTPGVAAFGVWPGASNPYVFYLDKGEGEAVADQAVWMRATASAEIVLEALKRAGRGVSRESLIHEIEGFHQVMTTLGAPISFGPDRRMGR
jgi:cytochrome c553